MVNYLNKLLIILVHLVLVIGCTSNVLNNTYDSSKVISIDKPKTNYDLNKLPQEINIFLFNASNISEREFISGISTNYYYFKAQLNYTPEINFITKEDLDKTNCYLRNSSKDYSIIFFTREFIRNLNLSCLNKILGLKALIVTSDRSLKFNEQNQDVLNFDKQSEYRNLLKYARSKGSFNSLIIDDKNTLDKGSATKVWEELEGSTLGSSTSDGGSNQNLLSKMLLIENSKERARRLSRALSIQTESIPRRRMDIDSIILTASLLTARSLKPELEYNFGESISVYLFPNWEMEDFYLDQELDLEKVYLIDLPWMFNSEIPYLQGLPKKRNRYFALGYDSYDISLLLNNSFSQRQFKFNGLSGQLAYKNGKLYRNSLKVIIQEGMFETIGY